MVLLYLLFYGITLVQLFACQYSKYTIFVSYQKCYQSMLIKYALAVCEDARRFSRGQCGGQPIGPCITIHQPTLMYAAVLYTKELPCVDLQPRTGQLPLCMPLHHSCCKHRSPQTVLPRTTLFVYFPQYHKFSEQHKAQCEAWTDHCPWWRCSTSTGQPTRARTGHGSKRGQHRYWTAAEPDSGTKLAAIGPELQSAEMRGLITA